MPLLTDDDPLGVEEFATHRLPLERINEGFDLMHQGKSIRGVVIY